METNDFGQSEKSRTPDKKKARAPTHRSVGTSSGMPTATLVHEQGEVKTRMAILLFAGVINVLLIAGGLIAYFVNPDKAKDLWLIIGPIITASVSGITGYFLGHRAKR